MADNMFAVIETGGKQYRVAEGERLAVERVPGDEVSLRPVLVVDGDTVLATASQLAGAAVTARVIGEARGPKINGFTYKDKTRSSAVTTATASTTPRSRSPRSRKVDQQCRRRRAPVLHATAVIPWPSAWA